jgi:hypothetical protein
MIGMIWRRTNPLSDQLAHVAGLLQAADEDRIVPST